MERTIAKLLAITGVVIGATIALTPVSSYAATVYDHGKDCDPTKPSTQTNADGWGIINKTNNGCAAQNGQNEVKVTVIDFLTLDAASGTSIDAASGQLKTGNISATVTSTGEYTLSLSAANPSLVGTTDSSSTIPAKSNFTQGTDGWGIKKNGESAYTAVTTSPVVFYTGSASDKAQITSLEVGVAVTDKTKPDTYQTTVAVTAAAKI